MVFLAALDLTACPFRTTQYVWRRGFVPGEKRRELDAEAVGELVQDADGDVGAAASRRSRRSPSRPRTPSRASRARRP